MKYAVKTALATSWTSSKDIVIPSNGSSNPFEKTSHLFERLTGAIRFKAIVNFSNRSSQSVEKTQDVIRAKKKRESSGVQASVIRSKKYNSAFCLATKLNYVFECNKL